MIPEKLYRDALATITPHPDTAESPAGANVSLALCCCALVISRHLQYVASAIDALRDSIDRARK